MSTGVSHHIASHKMHNQKLGYKNNVFGFLGLIPDIFEKVGLFNRLTRTMRSSALFSLFRV